MEHTTSRALGTVRDMFKHAGNSPGRLAQAVCELCISCGWAQAARLSWSADFAAALADAGEPGEPSSAGEVAEAAWAEAWELGPGPQGPYSLLLAAACPQASSGMAVAAVAAGLDVFLDAWQRNQSLQVALQRTEQGRVHFQRLFHTVPVSTAIVAKDRSILDVNQAYCERFGFTREQALGRSMSDLGVGLIEEDRQRLSAQLQQHRSARNLILSGLRKDGKIYQVLVNAEMVEFDGEDRVLISSMDVTDMLRAEAANVARLQAETESQAKGRMLAQIAEEKAASDRLRVLADEARNNLQRLSELGRQVTASLDPQVIVATLSQGLTSLMPADGLRILVLDDDERLQSIGDWGAAAPISAEADQDEDAHLRELSQCLHRPGLATLQRDERSAAWRHAPIGARSALVAPLSGQQGPLGLLVVYVRGTIGHTVTHRAVLETLALHVGSAIRNARAYAQLQIAQKQLVEREKLAALGSLVAGVAHELNTPLGNALLLTSTLNERFRALPAEAPPGEDVHAAMGELRQLVTQAGPLIEHSLRSAAGLMSSFKQVAADQTADRRRSFDLAQVVGELAATMHNQLQPHQHALSVEIPSGVAMDGFPGALLQVLSNLILNAVQHGLEGRTHGRIAIVAARQRRDEVLIEFSDNGQGISEAHLKRVFEPFFTTRLGKGGTGLGLSISYNIVTSVLGGSIQVSSPPGGGVVFKMSLPLVAPSQKPMAEQPGGAEALR